MLTELTNDLCRQLKRNLARFDNDASACYDRIIVALGMLAAQRCGMPDNSIRTHTTFLQQMKYSVKTAHGISQDTNQGSPHSPLFGTGQGSCASPAVWLTLVVTLTNTLDRLITPRMKFSSPDSSMRHGRLIDVFVDDTSLGFAEPTGSATLADLTDSLAHIAQTWEKLLFYSGCSLHLQKCSWYALHWQWKKGRPTLTTFEPHHKDLTLTTQGQDNEPPTIIRRSEINTANRIYGIYLSRDGDFSTQLKILKKKADTYAQCLCSPRTYATGHTHFSPGSQRTVHP